MLPQRTRSRIGLGLGTLVAFSLLLLTTAAAPALARKPVVAYVDSGGALQFYDAEVGMNVGAPPLTIPGSPPQFAISHSGRYVVYLDGASDVHLFDRATSVEVALPGIDVYASPRNLTVSDTGFIAFDNNGSGPARVYDAIAQSFTEVGFAANNGHRQTRLSGDGDILATTCLINCEHFTNNEDYDVFLQDLSTDTDVPFPDTLGGAQKNEERPCVDADASLVGTDIPNPTQRDVFLYDRATSAAVALPNLNDAAADDIRCVLDSAGDYLGVTTASGAFRVYERSSGTFLTLPAGVGPPAWLTAPYTAPPRTGPRRPVVAYVDPASGEFGLYDTETDSDLAPPPLPNDLSRFAISADGRYVVYSDPATRDIHLFDRQGEAGSTEVPLPGIDVFANPGSLSVSDTGLIGFDDNGNGPARVYDSATGQFVDTGLPAANGHRQTRLSGNGAFLATTCIPLSAEAPCLGDPGDDGEVYVQDLTTQQDTGFPADRGGAGLSENRPCITADGLLVGFDVAKVGDYDVVVYDREGGAVIPLAGLRSDDRAERDCVLDPVGDHIGVSDNSGNFRMYERSSGGFLTTLPARLQNIVAPVSFSGPFQARPDTRITEGPSGTVASANATFRFESPTTVGASFECRIDDGGFEPCPSPKTYTGLADGRHTFAVRATADGLSDNSPATRVWTIDTTPPETTITSGPTGETGEQPTFEFGASEPGSTFQCRLDQGPFEDCSSPKAYANLALGEHSFAVKARDLAGNADPTPATRDFELCDTSETVDVVTVLATCIRSRGDGTLLATGDVRFDNGTRILTRASQDPARGPAPLVLDPAQHEIRLAPHNDSPRGGDLMSGTREIACGRFVIKTQGRPGSQEFSEAAAGFAGLAYIEGEDRDCLKLSMAGFALVAKAAQRPYVLALVRKENGGGVLAGARLFVPLFTGSGFGGATPDITALARPERPVRMLTHIEIQSPIPIGLGWGVDNLTLAYDERADLFYGVGGFETPGLYFGAEVEMRGGRLAALGVELRGDLFYCEGCTDPALRMPDPSCFRYSNSTDVVPDGQVPCPSPGWNGFIRSKLKKFGDEWKAKFSSKALGSVIALRGARLKVANLDGLHNGGTGGGGGGGLAGGLVRLCLPNCPRPVRVEGGVVVTALGDRLIGTGDFQYTLSGELFVKGHIGTAPLLGASFPIPTDVNGFESSLDAINYGLDFAEATAHFKPPRRFTVSGYFIMPPTPFIKGTFAVGIDPPRFTAEGGVELIVPQGAPLFGGQSFGGVYGLISNLAAGGKVSVRICAPKWAGGGCIGQSLSAAYLWQSKSFRFGVDLANYRTVSMAATAAAQRAPRTLRVPRGWEMAAFRVRSRKRVPNVRLTSPRKRGRRYAFTTASARRSAGRGGVLASLNRRRHEVTFLVAQPPAGKWRLKRLGGPRVVRAQVATRSARRASSVDLRPAGAALPGRTLSTAEQLPLSFRSGRPPRGTTVDLYADDDDHGAGGQLIAADLRPSATATWRLEGLGTGRWWPYAVIKRDGIPVETRYWPDSVQVVEAGAPPAPDGVSAEATPEGARVRWNQTAGAAGYVVSARPVPASAGEAVEESVPASDLGVELALRAGLRYEITVQAFDDLLRRSAESSTQTLAATGEGDPPPSIAGEPAPFAVAGQPWAFAPVLADLQGQSVRLRLASGPRGMRVNGRVVEWTPRRTQTGMRRFALEAVDSAGRVTRRSFSVGVNPAFAAPPVLGSGITVTPGRVNARRGALVTIAGKSLSRRARVFVGRKRIKGVRSLDRDLISVRVRCLKPGVHRVRVRRADGTTESLSRGLVVRGKPCTKRRPRR